MKLRLWPKPRWLRVAILLATVLLLPYVVSRLASPWRCLSVHSPRDVGAPQTQMPVMALRVACYNIAHGRGLGVSNWDGGSRAGRTARLDQIADLLRTMDANVVVLNEVDFDSSWSYSVNQASYLAAKAGYPHRAEQRNVDVRVLVWKWRFGNAVLSRFPITDARVVELPAYSTWETVLAGKKRGIVCDMRVGDQTVRVIGTHLSRRSESLRVESAVVLAGIAAESTLPTIVAGDLNSTPPGFPSSASDSSGNNALATFDNSGCFQRSLTNRPPTDKDLTFHSAEPRCVIDWVLIPPDWQFTQYGVRLSQLSDHRPVYAEVAPTPSATSSVGGNDVRSAK